MTESDKIGKVYCVCLSVAILYNSDENLNPNGWDCVCKISVWKGIAIKNPNIFHHYF